jgi:zinc transporter ZupT
MSTLTMILLATALGGALSALLAGLVLLLPANVRERILPHSVSFATGALLATALLALIPHAMQGAGPFKAHAIGSSRASRFSSCSRSFCSGAIVTPRPWSPRMCTRTTCTTTTGAMPRAG